MTQSLMTESVDKRVELILQQLEEIPPLPPIAAGVVALRRTDAAGVAELVALVTPDAALSARVLQLVAAPDQTFTSIEEAIVARGFEAIRYAVLAICIYETFAA